MTLASTSAPSLHEEPRTTSDRLFGGALSLTQPARGVGYRVNVDAILLAAFAARLLPESAGTSPGRPRRARHALDLGSGVGAVSLSLLHFNAADRVTLLEIDEVLAALAGKNLADNGWNARGNVQCADVLAIATSPREPADLIVCNPPFVPPTRGRLPSAHVARAKVGELDGFVRVAAKMLGRRARACFVYPAIEATTLLCTLRSHGLEPKRLRAVHASPRSAARVLLVEAALGKRGGLGIEPPLVETDETGTLNEPLGELLRMPRQEGDRAQSHTPLERLDDSSRHDHESAR